MEIAAGWTGRIDVKAGVEVNWILGGWALQASMWAGR